MLWLELLEGIKAVEAAAQHKQDLFGFTVEAKATPSAEDHPWVASCCSGTPAEAQLHVRQTILSINGLSAAGLPASAVKRMVAASPLALRLELADGAAAAAAAVVVLWRGPLGRARELAERWCGHVEHTCARLTDEGTEEQDPGAANSLRALCEMRRALMGFLALLGGPDDTPDHICQALLEMASRSQGACACVCVRVRLGFCGDWSLACCVVSYPVLHLRTFVNE